MCVKSVGELSNMTESLCPLHFRIPGAPCGRAPNLRIVGLSHSLQGVEKSLIGCMNDLHLSFDSDRKKSPSTSNRFFSLVWLSVGFCLFLFLTSLQRKAGSVTLLGGSLRIDAGCSYPPTQGLCTLLVTVWVHTTLVLVTGRP